MGSSSERAGELGEMCDNGLNEPLLRRSEDEARSSERLEGEKDRLGDGLEEEKRSYHNLPSISVARGLRGWEEKDSYADPDNRKKPDGHCTWRQWKLTVRMIKPWEILPMVGLSLLNLYLGRMLGYIPGDFYTCLAKRDKAMFLLTMRKQGIVALACSMSFGSVSALGNYCNIVWRKRITLKMHKLYCRDQAYYRKLGSNIDSPDQRIQREAAFYSQNLQSFVQAVAACPFTIAYYTFIAYQYLDGKLIVCMYGYFCITILLQRYLAVQVTPYIMAKEKAEAEFRTALIRVNNEAEAIALSGEFAENRERFIVDRKYFRVLSIQYKILFRFWLISWSSSLIDYLGSSMNYLLLGIVIFGGFPKWNVSQEELPKMISNASFVVFMLINAFSQVTDLAMTYSRLLAYTNRVGAMIEQLPPFVREGPDGGREDFNHEGGLHSPLSRGDLVEGKASLVGLENVTLSLGLQPIVKNLTLKLNFGESLYVCGPSGSGKTLFIKALCGLAEVRRGRIDMPHRKLVFVLPQNPLLLEGGTIAEQIAYPRVAVPDQLIVHGILTKIGLAHLEYYSGNVKQLSRVDVQKLCIARVLYHKPLLALLDDALSFLPFEEQELIYRMLQDNGIWHVSTGSEHFAARYPGQVLHLKKLI